MYKIFVFRKGRVKANYDNVRICVAVASQAGDWRQKRRIKINLQLKSESEKKSLHVIYDAMKQKSQFYNYLRCNEAKEQQSQFYNYIRCNEAENLVLQLFTMQ